MIDEKICNFYANEVHLGVTIVPFVAKKIEENNKICTLLDSNLNNEIKDVISRININSKLKNEIMKINWNKSNFNEDETKRYIENELKDNSNIYIIINGKEDEVEEKNKYIDEIRKNNKDKNINVVNCFEYDKIKVNEGFLSNYNKILNSSGCRYIK